MNEPAEQSDSVEVLTASESTAADQRTRIPTAISRKAVRWGWLEWCLLASVVLLLYQLSPFLIRTWREWPRPGYQTPNHMVIDDDAGTRLEIQYFLYLPEHYSTKQRWPMLLFLHGSGPRDDSLDDVAKEGPPYFLSRGKSLPMIVVSPHCGSNVGWNSSQLLSLLDYLQQTISVDPDRIYLTGYSMGGYATWELAETAPQRFAAVAPVAGGGNVAAVKSLAKLPIWAFHGKQDTVVPFDRSREMIDAITAIGGNAKLTEYDHAGHAIDKTVYADNELYDWLLQQHRPSN